MEVSHRCLQCRSQARKFRDRQGEQGTELRPSPESGSPTSEVKKRFACPDFPVHCYICPAEAADFVAALRTSQQSTNATQNCRQAESGKTLLCEDRKVARTLCLTRTARLSTQGRNVPIGRCLGIGSAATPTHECRRITEAVHRTMPVSHEHETHETPFVRRTASRA